MLNPLTYWIVLLTVSGYAFAYGRPDERWTVSICIAATLGTMLIHSPLNTRFSTVEGRVLVVDLLALAGFTFIALRSDRFWPLWVAGLQLTTILAHAMKAVDFALVPQIYAAAARLWVYPIFLIIVIGTWRTQHRESLREPPPLG